MSQQQREQRHDELFKLGLKWDGSHFKNEELGIYVSYLDVMTYKDTGWNIMINEIKKRMTEQSTFDFGSEETNEQSKKQSEKETITTEDIGDLPFVPDPVKDDKKQTPKQQTESKAQDLVVLDQPAYVQYKKRALNEIVLASKITVINNDPENAHAREVGKALTDLSKEVNKIRLATNKQWDKKIEDNNTEARKITQPLDDQVMRIKRLINDYEIKKEELRKAELRRIEEEKKAKEEAERKELERIEKIKNSLKMARESATKEIEKDDYDALIAIEQKVSGWYPKEDFYKEFIADAMTLKEEMLGIINLKKPVLEKIKAQKEEAARLDGIAKQQAEKELALQREALNQQKEKEKQAEAERLMAEQKAEIEAKQELTVLLASMGISEIEQELDELVFKYKTAALAISSRDKIIEDFLAAQALEKQKEDLQASKVKNQRTDFLFNIVDESVIPREFLKVDEVKIRSAIQEHRKLLEKDINGFKISGVEIYSEKKTILK